MAVLQLLVLATKKTEGDMGDIVTRLKEFIESEGKSCSMDIGGITPLYVYRCWGGSVPLKEIERAMSDVKLMV